MRFSLIITFCVLGTTACDLQSTSALSACAQDMKGDVADSSSQLGTCAAAKGLSGINLVCVDFDQVAALTDQKLSGWDFTNPMVCPGWVLSGGKLQVSNFGTFTSSCSFLLRPINLTDAEKQKYQNFTLSVVHTLDLNKQKQTAAIYLGAAQDTQQMWLGTGANPKQITTVTIAKAALPNGGGTTYQPLFKLASSVAAGGTAQGWQIESIAVNASQ